MLDNTTIIRTHNTTWVDGLIDLKVDVTFLQGILDSVYLAISDLGTLIQNGTIIRNTNTSWITENQYINTSLEMQTAVNQSGYFYDITTSDLQAGSSVVSDAEVDNNITINTTSNADFQANITITNGSISFIWYLDDGNLLLKKE